MLSPLKGRSLPATPNTTLLGHDGDNLPPDQKPRGICPIILGSPSKPSLTFPLPIRSNITVSMGALPSERPIAIDSRFFLVKTSIAKSPVLVLIASSIPPPRVRRNALRQQEHLHHGAGRENLHDGAARRLDFRSRLAHLHTRDFLDLLSQ